MSTTVYTMQQLADKIRKFSMFVYRNGHSMGFTEENTLDIQFPGIYSRASVDEIISPEVRVDLDGFAPVATFTLMTSEPEFVASQIYKGFFPSVAGSLGSRFDVCDQRVNVRVENSAKWEFIPKTNQPGDKTNSFVFYSGYADLQDTPLSFKGSKTDFQKSPVTIKAQPILEGVSGACYASMGNLNAEDLVPLALAIVGHPFHLQIPILSKPEFELDPDGRELETCMALYGNETDGPDAQIDEVGNITAPQKSFNYKILSVPGGIVPGSIIKLGTGVGKEYVYVLEVTAATDTTGTINDCVRGVMTPRSIHNDSDPIQVLTQIHLQEESQIVDWASATPAAAIVGNIQGEIGPPNQKGLVSHVAAGSSVLTATKGGTVSPDCLVTTNA